MKAADVYAGSDGELTKRYYAELEKRGPAGVIAVNLFRAQKNSARAKVYRGGIRGQGSYREMAYQRKNWSSEQLASALDQHGAAVGIGFGWKIDPQQPVYKWVLYVDLPTGQASFHSGMRYAGPDYPGDWDGWQLSDQRILDYCDQVYQAGREVPA